MIPLIGGWIITRKCELTKLSQNWYKEGRSTGIIETDDLVQSSRILAADNRKATLKIETLEEEILRLGELIDQTQKDAYDLGYSHGSRGIIRRKDSIDEKERDT